LESTNIAVEEDVREERPTVVPPITAEEEKIEELTTHEKVVEKVGTSSEEELENKTIEEPVPIPDSELEPKHQEAEKEEPKEENKKRSWLWLLIILIPLVVVSVFIFVKDKTDRIEDKPTVNKPETKVIEQAAIISQDTVKVDSVVIVPKDTIIIEEPKANTKVEANPDLPKYYLVGGSFSVEENAETYLKELKDKGFDAFHVGKKGRFFIVGIGTYDTFTDAEKAKKDYMTDNPGSEVWVYKK